MIRLNPRRKPVLAITWDESRLYYVRARIGGARITILESEIVEQRQDGDAEPKKLSSAKSVVLCAVPRSQVEMLHLELPPASDSVLPLLVRNEVSRQLADLSDDCIVDFTSESQDAAQRRRVNAFVLRADRMRALGQRNDSLGIQPDRLVLRPLATASLFRRIVGRPHQRSMLVTVLDHSIDISIFEQGEVVFTRSVRVEIPSDIEATIEVLTNELQRTLLVSENDRRQQVGHVYMFGNAAESEPLISGLADKLELPVSVLDPFDGTKRRGAQADGQRFAPLIGMIRDHADNTAAVDFLHPRRAAPKASPWRKLVFYASAAAIAIFAIVFSFSNDLQSANQQLESYRNEVAKQQKILKKLQQKASVVKAIESWEANEINLLDELRDLSLRFPSSDRAIVRNFTAASSGDVMSISMQVRASDPSIVSDVEQRLRDSHRSIQNKRFSQQEGSQPFSSSFQSLLQVKHRDKADYAKQEQQSVSEGVQSSSLGSEDSLRGRGETSAEKPGFSEKAGLLKERR